MKEIRPNKEKPTFLEMLEKHNSLLQRVCIRYSHSPEDREDLFQEILIQLWLYLPKFRQQCKWTTWVYRIALNTAISSMRKRKRRMVPLTYHLYEIHKPHFY